MIGLLTIINFYSYCYVYAHSIGLPLLHGAASPYTNLPILHIPIYQINFKLQFQQIFLKPNCFHRHIQTFFQISLSSTHIATFQIYKIRNDYIGTFRVDRTFCMIDTYVYINHPNPLKFKIHFEIISTILHLKPILK